MCPECYESWNQDSIRYSSDIPFEVKTYNSMCHALNIMKWHPDVRDEKVRYKGKKAIFMKELEHFCKTNNKHLTSEIKEDIWLQIQYHPSPFSFRKEVAYENATNPNRV